MPASTINRRVMGEEAEKHLLDIVLTTCNIGDDRREALDQLNGHIDRREMNLVGLVRHEIKNGGNVHTGKWKLARRLFMLWGESWATETGEGGPVQGEVGAALKKYGEEWDTTPGRIFECCSKIAYSIRATARFYGADREERWRTCVAVVILFAATMPKSVFQIQMNDRDFELNRARFVNRLWFHSEENICREGMYRPYTDEECLYELDDPPTAND